MQFKEKNQMPNKELKCCDTCKHYKWYYDKCSKYNCETDARARCSDYENISELKGRK